MHSHQDILNPPPPSSAYRITKRLLDLCGALVMLLLTSPLLLWCAVWIRLVDGGPVLYTQWRVGADDWLFRIYKLRTMRQDAEQFGAVWAANGDPRILQGCRWMRRSHVDELPQLWNILIGQMSLVGPRPERPEMTTQLTRRMLRFVQRLAGVPGLTGLAQVRHGYTNDVRGARRKLAYDLVYLRRRSLWEDLRLLLLTGPKLWDQAAL